MMTEALNGKTSYCLVFPYFMSQLNFRQTFGFELLKCTFGHLKESFTFLKKNFC